MRTYSLENKGNVSIYEYLYECIKSDILTGILKPEEKLPSKRSFATNQGVSIVTVENTYGQLLAEGYIYSKAKSGFYVSKIEILDTNAKQLYTSYSNTKSINSKQLEKKYINLVSNSTTPENFPFSSWARISRNTLTEKNDEILVSPPTGGVWELRQAIAKHLLEFRGISVRPEQIIIGAGSEYLYGLIVQLLGREKNYGLENPGSKKIKDIYEALGVKVSLLSMDDEGVLVCDDNLKGADILQISPSHQFPLGVVTSIGRRYSLLQWANESDERYIIEDDYDSEFRLQGRPIPSLFSMDNTDKVIYFNTFSKSLTSTIRISYMVLPEHLLERFESKLGFYSCTVSNFEQYVLAGFIGDGYFEKHINRMRNHYRGLRDELIMKLKESAIGNKIEIMEENSGLHFVMKIATSYSDEELKKKAYDQGIIISFLLDYYNSENTITSRKSNNISSNNYAGCAIVNYSGIDETKIHQVVMALEKAWE